MKKKNTVLQLLSYIRPYMPLFIISLAMTAFSVISSLLIPVMFGRGIDLIGSKGNVDINGILHIAFIILLIIAVGAICQWITGYLNNIITFKIIRELRTQTFQKIEELPISYLDSKTSGEL